MSVDIDRLVELEDVCPATFIIVFPAPSEQITMFFGHDAPEPFSTPDGALKGEEAREPNTGVK
jgi:hypothetical protein